MRVWRYVLERKQGFPINDKIQRDLALIKVDRLMFRIPLKLAFRLKRLGNRVRMLINESSWI